MCQVNPFTLPCCRRIYVSVSKLPSCPESWPKSKCPPELCIQLGGHEALYAHHREFGVCWRCKAHNSGFVGQESERLRPGLDTAFIVPGLEELGPADRRRLAEADGICWFCGTKGENGNCAMCAEKMVGATAQPRSAAWKRRRDSNGAGRISNKKLKTSKYTDKYQTPPEPASNYFLPDPQQVSFQQSHDQSSSFGGFGLEGPSRNQFDPFQDSAALLQNNIDPALLALVPNTNWYPTKVLESGQYGDYSQSNGPDTTNQERFQSNLGHDLAEVAEQDFAAGETEDQNSFDAGLEMAWSLKEFENDPLCFEPYDIPEVNNSATQTVPSITSTWSK